MRIQIKFKKIHPEAQLPSRKHENHDITPEEVNMEKEAQLELSIKHPEMVRYGYKAQMPRDEQGKLVGTGDTGFDIFAVENAEIPAKGSAIISTGIEVAYITPGYWFKIESRSGMGFKSGIMTHPGVVDNNYRGNCGVKLYNFSDEKYVINKGDRIAQLVIYPVISPVMEWAEEKVETNRNEGGFGSTGK